MVELGDFDRVLDIASDLVDARRRPISVRPKRPLIKRMISWLGGTDMAPG